MSNLIFSAIHVFRKVNQLFFVHHRLEKKRKRKKRNRSRSKSLGRRSGRESSKTPRRPAGKKLSLKVGDDKESNQKEQCEEVKEVSTVEPAQVPGINEYTSDDSKKIVISSIEDIPVVDDNSQKTETDENTLAQVEERKPGEDIDDDAKALAEIEKEGEAYNARQKKKSNFSFEILSSKSSRLRHLIQMNNSNKANNNSGGTKDFTSTENKMQLVNKDKNNSNSIITPSAQTISSPLTKKLENKEKEDKQTIIDSPSSKQKQPKPERTSRFGPSIVNTEATSSNPNLKYPKFLPKSNINTGGLLPTPVEGKSTNTTKYYSKDNLAEVETDSLGRIRRKR